ncbi:M23 family metallopeptidase [Anaerosporobacter sp.]|uniref:M23 family metallopeptidase n=1 Tax=Anaerosporobacter sp. TaxID=1872529 RepID=UPI00286EBFF9|nr:M23 family metallopeptidase [Anaerosporobacter sp.]
MKRKDKYRILIVMSILILAIVNTCLLSFIHTTISYKHMLHKLQTLDVNMEYFRSMEFTEDSLAVLLYDDDKKYADRIENITLSMMVNSYTCTKDGAFKYKKLSESMLEEIRKTNLYRKLYERYKIVLSDIRYFPVPEDLKKKYAVSYENSWGNPRSYGGNRRHEGTDIMAKVNKRGLYPIVSVSDGVVEKKGWLEQGGYRIGIRSENGAYYYYAHLYSYAPDLEIGDTVLAGQFIGFMGDTGYSKIEGTTGNFDVHLHFGIYYMEDGEEISVNPYYILNYLEHNKLSYAFSE